MKRPGMNFYSSSGAAVPTPSNLAVITGAGRGIGAAIARMFAEEGIAVLLLARNKQALEDVAAYLEAEGGAPHVLAVDISVAADLEKVTAFVKSFNGKLRYLVHNAAVARVGKISGMAVADWRRTLDVNLTAPFSLTQRMLPFMTDGGHIFFINSVAGKQVFPEWGAYSASKFGLRALADTLRLELAADGIKVTTLYPSAVDTPLHEDLPYNWEREKMMKPQNIADALKYIIHQPANICVNELDLASVNGLF